MFKGKLQTSLIVLMSIFMSAVSMQAQAWSYGVSWYSDINFTFTTKGNKLKLANGNYVLSDIYAFDYVSKCIATNSGNLTLHSGIGNNGNDSIISDIVQENSDDNVKNKGTFSATGTLSLEDMYQHYTLLKGENDGTPDPLMQCYEGDGSPLNAPTGLCTEDDRNPEHMEHFCHAEADQKVEHKDNLYFPHIAVWVRVVKGNEAGTAPAYPLVVIEQGIAECTYDGEVTLDENGDFVTETKPTECEVTEYPLEDDEGEPLDPRFDHVLSF